ncbi:MAG: ABC transporter ATP-binding protein [Deltaproteobacteria bacterium]|nr:ABC transporter ATP-binding protein [Deltaproteobacteria bacterium]
MMGEYGYAEEGKLGKPYNLKLMKRLAYFARPYTKKVVAGLMLSILVALFDLCVPYLTKIAIDRYILVSWYEINGKMLSDKAFGDLKQRYGPLMDESAAPSVYYISNLNLKKIDPAHIHILKDQGLLGSKRFYRIGPDREIDRWFRGSQTDIHKMADGASMVSYENLERLPNKELLQIRAGDINGVTLVAGVFFVLLLLSLGFSYVEYYIMELTGQRIMQDIRMKLFDRMQAQTLRFFDRYPVGTLVTRVTNDIGNLNEMFKSVLITVFKDIFMIVGILVVLLYLNWRLALLCFIMLPIIFGLTFFFSFMAREAFRELRSTVSRINAFLQERISGMRIIQLFVREKSQMTIFAGLNRDNYQAGMKQIRIFALFMPLMELLSALAIAFLIWHGGGQVLQEEMTLGVLVAFIGYIQMFFKPIRDISEKYNIMQMAMASMERIFEFMDKKEVLSQSPSPRSPSRVQGHLVFDHVSFGYDPEKKILHDVSFEVKPGETIAIVGATGSGKTTVVSLVERFYDPDRGSITLDGIDLREWSNENLRNAVSLCMQDVFIFAGTVSENIALGRKNLKPEAAHHAAETANALGFIERLENGFLQELGEQGATLSGGQRQLLSFARALASDPSLLILDEATSSVDPETERLIQTAISKMAHKRTTLVVAHRLSTVRDADRILVMHNGRIREQGTHEELMALEGLYFKLSRRWERGKTT